MKALDSKVRQNSGTGNEFLENLIDTYEMIAGVFQELGGQNNFQFQLDRTLPFISGKTDLVKKILYLYISDLVQSHGKDWRAQYLFVSHVEEKSCWIFNFHPMDSLPEGNYWAENNVQNFGSTPAPYSLLIPKSSVRDSFRNSDISNL